MRRVLLGSTLTLAACVPGGNTQHRLGTEEMDPPVLLDAGLGAQGPLPTYWQDIRPVFERSCALCHGATPQGGAPMSLMRYEDVVAPAFSAPARAVHELLGPRMRRADGKPIMPPANLGVLTEAEIALVERWSLAGAPEGIRPAPRPDAGLIPLDASAPPPGPEDGGLPADPEAPYVELEVVAPQAAVRAGSTDLYGCFRTVVETATPLHAVEITPVIAQPAIVHHILFFRDRSRSYPAEKTGLLCAADTVGRDSLELLHGWAPGGGPMVLPREAGVRLEDGDHLVVQMHYNNATATNLIDTSGMRLKATARLRANDAAVVGVGTESFSLPPGQAQVERSGTCTLDRSVHVYSHSPHMHLLGRGARLERLGAQPEVLADVTSFGFEQQVAYPAAWDLASGEQLRATCVFDTTSRTGTTRFGEGTTDEMCYIFLAHYPPLGQVSCTR